jgi:hypothetical protein
MWCEKNLAHEVDMKDDGDWQVVVEVLLVLKRFQSTEGSSGPRVCFFKFKGGQRSFEAPSRWKVRDVRRVSWCGGEPLLTKRNCLFPWLLQVILHSL